MLLISITVVLVLSIIVSISPEIKNIVTGKFAGIDSVDNKPSTTSDSQGSTPTNQESQLNSKTYEEFGSISMGERDSFGGTSIITENKIKFGVALVDERGKELDFTTKGRLVDPEGNLFQTFNITTNKNITLNINKTKLGYWTINLSNGTKTKNFLVALSKDEKEILKNINIVQDGFQKLPNDASLADILLNLDKKENSLLKNILKPLEQTENPLFSPLKSSETIIEPIIIQKSPLQREGKDISVQLSMKKPEVEKEDVLTVSIKDKKPYINFNFRF